MSLSSQQPLMDLALSVKAACEALNGKTQGTCREAAIVLAELLLARKLVPVACVSQGTYDDHGHFWVRVVLGEQSLIIDPTADQFDAAAPILIPEGAAAKYKEDSYLLFSQHGLASLRARVQA